MRRMRRMTMISKKRVRLWASGYLLVGVDKDAEKARVEVYKKDTKGCGRKRPAISNCPPPSSCYVVADTTHIVILMQPHPISAPGTYADFHSLDHAMQGICSQYELGSQKRNSIMGNSQYTLDDVYAFVDSHADMSAFVLADADLQTYQLKDKSWIKEQLKSSFDRSGKRTKRNPSSLYMKPTYYID